MNLWAGVGTKKILVGTRNPLEPTFWVPTRNPEPTGAQFLGSGPEPGTHCNPIFEFRPWTRNPLEPTFWVPTLNPEPTGTQFLGSDPEHETHWNPISVGSNRNPWVPGFRTCRPLLVSSIHRSRIMKGWDIQCRFKNILNFRNCSLMIGLPSASC